MPSCPWFRGCCEGYGTGVLVAMEGKLIPADVLMLVVRCILKDGGGGIWGVGSGDFLVVAKLRVGWSPTDDARH